MLFQFLDNLRQKPKPVRNQYAFGFALCSTVIIAGVWSLSLPSRFASLGNTAAVGSATEAASTAPFAGLFNQLKEQFAGAKEVMQQLPGATTTPATAANTVSTSTQSDTEAALNMQINEENKTALQASSSATDAEYQGDTAAPDHQTIMIATTTATTTR